MNSDVITPFMHKHCTIETYCRLEFVQSFPSSQHLPTSADEGTDSFDLNSTESSDFQGASSKNAANVPAEHVLERYADEALRFYCTFYPMNIPRRLRGGQSLGRLEFVCFANFKTLF